MPKPPRGQTFRAGTPRGKGRVVTRKGEPDRSTRREGGQREVDSGSSETRDRPTQPVKKLGWAKAQPQKKTPWRAKSREQAEERRQPKQTPGPKTDGKASSTVDAAAGKRPPRARAAAGRGHVEQPDSRAQRRGMSGRQRAGDSERSTRSGGQYAGRTEPRGRSAGGVAPERGDRGDRGQRRDEDARGGRTGRVPGRRTPQPGDGAPASKMRISKAMARAGLCSRRDAERWIEEGRVVINGEKIASPARDVGPGDRILIDGQPLPVAEPTRLWRYSKPKGLVTTHRDPEGRPTVFDGLPDDMPRVMSIGRLDYNTEGLLLLTTDGELARYLELPATGWLRRYRVRAHGRVTQANLDALKEGVEVEGVHYGPVEATLDSQQGTNVWLTIGLREGKNREVRKILASLGLEVNRLIRVSFGPFQLLDMKPGTVEIVRRKVLIEQLGVRLAGRFNLAEDDDEATPRGPGRDTGRGTAKAPRRSPDQGEARQDRPPGRRRPGRDEEEVDVVREPRRPKSKDKRGGTPRGSQPKGGTPRNTEPQIIEVDENNLDDVKPWTIKTGAIKPGNNKPSGDKTVGVPRSKRRPRRPERS